MNRLLILIQLYVKFRQGLLKNNISCKAVQESVKEGETFTNKDEVKLTADILKAENGMKFFPVFSQEEQMPEEYKQRFTVIPITMMDCLKMAHGDSSVSGLVLDGFTTSFVLPFDLADYMAQIPSRLQKTDENE